MRIKDRKPNLRENDQIFSCRQCNNHTERLKAIFEIGAEFRSKDSWDT